MSSVFLLLLLFEWQRSNEMAGVAPNEWKIFRLATWWTVLTQCHISREVDPQKYPLKTPKLASLILPFGQQSVKVISVCTQFQSKPNTVGYARTDVIGSRTSFVIASVHSSIHWNIYVFRGNPFLAQSLQQSYHPTQILKHLNIIS